jgi:hypothetical protein
MSPSLDCVQHHLSAGRSAARVGGALDGGARVEARSGACLTSGPVSNTLECLAVRNVPIGRAVENNRGNARLRRTVGLGNFAGDHANRGQKLRLVAREPIGERSGIRESDQADARSIQRKVVRQRVDDGAYHCRFIWLSVSRTRTAAVEIIPEEPDVRDTAGAIRIDGKEADAVGNGVQSALFHADIRVRARSVENEKHGQRTVARARRPMQQEPALLITHGDRMKRRLNARIGRDRARAEKRRARRAADRDKASARERPQVTRPSVGLAREKKGRQLG